jgi:hypothetical protein
MAPRSPCEQHQARVENHWEQNMTRRHGDQRPKCNEIPNPPLILYKPRCENNRSSNRNETDKERPFELSEHLWQLFEERHLRGFLDRSSPGHVNRKELTQNCFDEMKGQASEEYGQERDPFEVFENFIKSQYPYQGHQKNANFLTYRQ